MNLIAFDLEMNRYNAEYLFDYHGGEQSLRGEIVQIGAVKLDMDGTVHDTFSLNLRPRIFRLLSPFVAKVTGITQHQLNTGVPVRDGLAQFVEWCGKDAVLLEWSMDDIPVLKQNLFINGLDEAWPADFYNLQPVFCKQFPLGENDKLNLEAVITRLGLPMNRDYHNALADALYTADICGVLDLAGGLAQYADESEQMRATMCVNPDNTYYNFTAFGPFYRRSAWDDATQIPPPCCPVCGAALLADEGNLWLPRGKNSRYAMQNCTQDGAWLVREKSIQFDGLHWSFARVLERPDEKMCKKVKADYARILKRRKDALEKAAAEQAAADTL
ncbi:MAG: 3'-5' exonuclease [Ruthenibacterium sp.]